MVNNELLAAGRADKERHGVAVGQQSQPKSEQTGVIINGSVNYSDGEQGMQGVSEASCSPADLSAASSKTDEESNVARNGIHVGGPPGPAAQVQSTEHSMSFGERRTTNASACSPDFAVSRVEIGAPTETQQLSVVSSAGMREGAEDGSKPDVSSTGTTLPGSHYPRVVENTGTAGRKSAAAEGNGSSGNARSDPSLSLSCRRLFPHMDVSAARKGQSNSNHIRSSSSKSRTGVDQGSSDLAFADRQVEEVQAATETVHNCALRYIETDCAVRQVECREVQPQEPAGSLAAFESSPPPGGGPTVEPLDRVSCAEIPDDVEEVSPTFTSGSAHADILPTESVDATDGFCHRVEVSLSCEETSHTHLIPVGLSDVPSQQQYPFSSSGLGEDTANAQLLEGSHHMEDTRTTLNPCPGECHLVEATPVRKRRRLDASLLSEEELMRHLKENIAAEEALPLDRLESAVLAMAVRYSYPPLEGLGVISHEPPLSPAKESGTPLSPTESQAPVSAPSSWSQSFRALVWREAVRHAVRTMVRHEWTSRHADTWGYYKQRRKEDLTSCQSALKDEVAAIQKEDKRSKGQTLCDWMLPSLASLGTPAESQPLSDPLGLDPQWWSQAQRRGLVAARDRALRRLGAARRRPLDPRDPGVPVVRHRLSSYIKLMQVGVGAYGEVWLAEDLSRRKDPKDPFSTFVAMKKLKLNEEREGFPKTAIREIALLQRLVHPCIVKLLAVVPSRPAVYELHTPDTYSDTDRLGLARPQHQQTSLGMGNIWMVFEYCPHDLSGLLEIRRQEQAPIPLAEVRLLMCELLSALAHCHSCGVLHRDLKTANLLITADGHLKLADFGLARYIRPSVNTLTNRVVTLWYRPPELLLGAEVYNDNVDVWSAGCILCELLLSRPPFVADKEPGVLQAMVDALGVPTDKDWPGRKKLPLWNQAALNPILESEKSANAGDKARTSSTNCNFKKKLLERGGALLLNLVLGMLSWDPSKRFSALTALNHPWLRDHKDIAVSLSMGSYKAQTHAFAVKKKNPGNAPPQPPNVKMHGRPSEAASSGARQHPTLNPTQQGRLREARMIVVGDQRQTTKRNFMARSQKTHEVLESRLLALEQDLRVLQAKKAERIRQQQSPRLRNNDYRIAQYGEQYGPSGSPVHTATPRPSAGGGYVGLGVQRTLLWGQDKPEEGNKRQTPDFELSSMMLGLEGGVYQESCAKRRKTADSGSAEEGEYQRPSSPDKLAQRYEHLAVDSLPPAKGPPQVDLHRPHHQYVEASGPPPGYHQLTLQQPPQRPGFSFAPPGVPGGGSAGSYYAPQKPPSAVSQPPSGTAPAGPGHSVSYPQRPMRPHPGSPPSRSAPPIPGGPQPSLPPGVQPPVPMQAPTSSTSVGQLAPPGSMLQQGMPHGVAYQTGTVCTPPAPTFVLQPPHPRPPAPHSGSMGPSRTSPPSIARPHATSAAAMMPPPGQLTLPHVVTSMAGQPPGISLPSVSPLSSSVRSCPPGIPSVVPMSASGMPMSRMGGAVSAPVAGPHSMSMMAMQGQMAPQGAGIGHLMTTTLGETTVLPQPIASMAPHPPSGAPDLAKTAATVPGPQPMADEVEEDEMDMEVTETQAKGPTTPLTSSFPPLPSGAVPALPKGPMPALPSTPQPLPPARGGQPLPESSPSTMADLKKKVKECSCSRLSAEKDHSSGKRHSPGTKEKRNRVEGRKEHDREERLSHRHSSSSAHGHLSSKERKHHHEIRDKERRRG